MLSFKAKNVQFLWKVIYMELEIRPPKLKELGPAIRVMYEAFKGEFRFIFGEHYELGKKLLVNFFKRSVQKQELENFLIAKYKNKIVATANLDFDNPRLIRFFFNFLKMNVHFLRASRIIGIRNTIRITLSMYWFFIENFRKNSCYINLFAVAPEYHNRGIGKKMLKEIEKITRKKGLGSMTLDVAFSDAPAQYLYKKIGFKEVHRFQNTFLKNYNAIDGIIAMKKPLVYGET